MLLAIGSPTAFAQPVDPDLQDNVIRHVQLDLLAEQDAFMTEAGTVEMQSVSAELAPFYQVGLTASMAAMVVALMLPGDQRDPYYLAAEIGSVVFTVSGVVTPFLFGMRHNRRLRDALQM
jgi:hypothetical protein